jgi:hypothetical protein
VVTLGVDVGGTFTGGGGYGRFATPEGSGMLQR